MSVATPKSQAEEPTQLDVVLVCLKPEADRRRNSQAETAFQRALEHAEAKARPLVSCGLALPVNDRRGSSS